MSTISPLCLSLTDAATTLGLSKSRLYELLGEGVLAARKIGGKTVILTAELQRYVAELPPAVIASSHRRRAGR